MGGGIMTRPAAVWGERILTEPASAEVVRAITGVIAAHSGEFDAVLHPYGFSVTDIAAPTYEVVVPADECPIFVELEREYTQRRAVQP